MAKTLLTKVGLASVIMMASVFLSRVIGLIREMVIAYFGGAGGSVDAYQVAFIIPEILNHVLASGFLSITFIPIFTGYLVKGQEKEGWRIFSLILTGFGACLVLLSIAAWWATPELLALTGLQNPGIRDQAIRMTRIMIPAQLFFFVGGLLMAVQFAQERFLIPALAPLLYNLGIIGGGVLLGPYLGMEGFAWGVLAGALVGNFLVQLIGARRVGLRFKPWLKLNHPDLKRYFWLTLPLMVGLTMTFSTEIFSKLFGSYLGEGSVAGLNYSLRLMFVLVGVFGQAAGVASYPFLARLMAEGKIAEMNHLLNTTLKMIWLVMPLAVLMMVLRGEIVRLVFQRGSFDSAATALTSGILPFVLAGTAAFAAQTMVSRGYYAMGNTLFPTLFGSLAVVGSLPLYWVGMHWMGVAGVALALSLSAALQVALLYHLWNRRTGNTGSRAVYRLLLKVIAISAVLGVVFEYLRTLLVEWIAVTTLSDCLGVLVVIAVAYLLAQVGVGSLCGLEEVESLHQRLKKRFSRAR